MDRNITGVASSSAIAKVQDNILTMIINPILGVATAISFALFLYGLVRFLINRTSNPDETSKGKKHIFWGIIALFVLLSIWSIFIGIGKGLESKVWFVN